MAKIKYTEGATPLLNEHNGYTFQSNHYGQSMFPSSRSSRKRYSHQWKRQHNNQKAVTRWRTMSAETKNAWNNFAAMFPQPTKANPDKFLTGYQCFIRRNSFCFLNFSIEEDFILEPELLVPEEKNISFQIKFSDNAIDATELYIKNFGILPKVGQTLLLYAAIYGEYNGNFYEPVTQQIIVEEIYLDGLFISVTIPDDFPFVVVSVYLSKPVSPGQTYVGTKPRYMGCFTTKKFIQLQDVFNTYIDKRKQIVIVNEYENGLTTIEAETLISQMLTGYCGLSIYDENKEWSHNDDVTEIDYEYEGHPFSKNLSILISEISANQYITFTSPNPLNFKDFKSIGLYLSLISEMELTQSISIQFFLEGLAVSDSISLIFNHSLLNEFQNILLLLSEFTLTETTFDAVTFTFLDSSELPFPAIQIDLIELFDNENGLSDNCLDRYVIGYEYDADAGNYIIHRNGNLPDLAVPVISGDKPIQVTGLTLSSTGWNLDGLYYYDLANANITAASSVEVIPANADIDTVVEAVIYPETDCSSGNVRIYAENEPTADISVTINIFEMTTP